MKKVLMLAPMSSVHERFNNPNIQALKQEEYEIHLAANFSLCAHDLEFRRTCEEQGIITHQMDFVRSSLLHNLKIIPQLKKLLKEQQYDIVHTHTETGGILVRLSLGVCKTSKYIYTPHGMSFYKGSSLKSQIIYRPIEKFICNKMNANIAINQEEFEVLSKWNRETAFYVHGVGLNVESIQANKGNKEKFRNEFSIPQDAFVIMSVGELNDNKNHKIVLDAICELENKNLYYLICGEGENREKITHIAQKNNFSDRLILTGYRYDVREILSCADVFAFPSFHEGLPVALMEAMATGLPIICSEIRGNVDLIKNGENGFLCKQDIKSYKNAIKELVTNEAKRIEFSQNNRKRILAFSDANVLEELKKIYNGEQNEKN